MLRSRNAAVTDLARFVATVQVRPDTESQPLHPVKPDRRPGLAVKVITALLAYDARVTTNQRGELTIGDLLGNGSNGAADHARLLRCIS